MTPTIQANRGFLYPMAITHWARRGYCALGARWRRRWSGTVVRTSTPGSFLDRMFSARLSHPHGVGGRPTGWPHGSRGGLAGVLGARKPDRPELSYPHTHRVKTPPAPGPPPPFTATFICPGTRDAWVDNQRNTPQPSADYPATSAVTVHRNGARPDLPCQHPCPPPSATTNLLRVVILRWLVKLDVHHTSCSARRRRARRPGLSPQYARTIAWSVAEIGSVTAVPKANSVLCPSDRSSGKPSVTIETGSI